MWEDESEAVAPIIWLYQTVDAQKEEVFFPDLLLTLRRYGHVSHKVTAVVTHKHKVYATFETHAAVSSCHNATSRPSELDSIEFLIVLYGCIRELRTYR